MPYLVSIDEKNEIILVRVWGRAPKEDHFIARDEAATLLKGKKYTKLLVDLSDLLSSGIVTTLGCFDFGTNLLTKLPPHIKIAHVLPHDPDSARDVKFLSAVAANRGGITAEFNTLEEAQNWLIHTPKEGEPRD
ncbi:hypothetical protein JXQ70_01050 [bacterium]|nr:hypothetical protein [bacterium]